MRRHRKPPRWLKDQAFRDLCDLVDERSLVVMTGAGISLGLTDHRGRSLPSWHDLLLEAARAIAGSLDRGDKRDLTRLLQAPPGETPTSDALIEAASILRAGDTARLERYVAGRFRLRAGTFGPVHRAILDLDPVGIVTFNYDSAHEEAETSWRKERHALGEVPPRWSHLQPYDEQGVAQCLASRAYPPFLMKAHGSATSSANSPTNIVLTRESYRALLVSCPAYRAFMQNLLTNYNFLFLGFGLSDLDFDSFLEAMSSQFGNPVRRHIVITRGEQLSARQVIVKRRYGIDTLLVSEWSELPDVLRCASVMPGPRIAAVISDALRHDDVKLRTSAHRRLQRLSRPGRKQAKARIVEILEQPRRSLEDKSELLYSLGYLEDDRREIHEYIKAQLPRLWHRELVAHGLEAIRNTLDASDIPWLEDLLARYLDSPPRAEQRFPDPDNRIPVYVEYLIRRLRAKRLEAGRRVAVRRSFLQFRRP